MSERRRHARGMLALVAVGSVCLWQIGWSRTSRAAQPRTTVSIKSGSVRLSDLFTGLEPGQDCTIGPAPAPGKSIVIEQAQLAAIAAQFGVDWQSGAIPLRVILERKARSVLRAELLALLRPALVAAGAAPGSDIALSGFATMSIPAEDTNPLDIDQLDFDPASGRFAAELLSDGVGADPVRLRVSGTAREMIEVPVLAHAMNAGSVIAPEDLELGRVRKSVADERTISATQEAVGLALRHRMMAGSTITADDLTRPLLVTRGMPVLLRLQNTGMTLTTKGEAIEGGALDDRIHILNPDSRAVLVARITGPGQVQVDPASTPVLVSEQRSGLPQPFGPGPASQERVQ